ncbi:SDR family NAD(P)-dependent oxidoreductase [Chloroflexota bacterium]
MDLGLSGKTAIVTGGASNIGRAISIAFLAEGANVVIADLDEAQAGKVAESVGGKAMVVRTDVTDYSQVEQLVQKTLDKYSKIDVLVNCVGWDKLMPFKNTDQDLWNKIIAINYVSVLNCFKLVLPHMAEQKSGTVVSISSDAGRVGEQMEAVYAGAKGAVIALSKSLAKENGRHGIRINVVCPGLVVPNSADETGDGSAWKVAPPLNEEQVEQAAKMYLLRKVGRPDDIANAVVFLASDSVAGNITGQTLSVDGGYTTI